MEKARRRSNFRYVVDLTGVQLTSLAAIEGHMGEEPLRVLNVSLGGLAIIFEKQKDYVPGDIVELSLSLRERAFPVTVEIKAVQGLRFSCQFVEASPKFLSSLKEFMAPKGIGESFELREDLTNNPQALALVKNSKEYQSFVGEKQSVAFIWKDSQSLLLKFLVVSQNKFLEWTQSEGLKTGYVEESSEEGLNYHSATDDMTKQYFADILLSWLSFDQGHAFTVDIMETYRRGGSVKFPTL